MKKYFIALIALVIAFFVSGTDAQIRGLPIKPVPLPPMPFTRPTPFPNPGPMKPGPISTSPNNKLLSATVKGTIYIKKEDAKVAFTITAYKLVNNRWVATNFSTKINEKGEYLAVVRGEGTYRFVPSVKFDPKFKYTFTPASQVVKISASNNDKILIRNFTYKKDNRK